MVFVYLDPDSEPLARSDSIRNNRSGSNLYDNFYFNYLHITVLQLLLLPSFPDGKQVPDPESKKEFCAD